MRAVEPKPAAGPFSLMMKIMEPTVRGSSIVQMLQIAPATAHSSQPLHLGPGPRSSRRLEQQTSSSPHLRT